MRNFLASFGNSGRLAYARLHLNYMSIVRMLADNLNLLSHSITESLPAFSAALAMPDLAAFIFSA